MADRYPFTRDIRVNKRRVFAPRIGYICTRIEWGGGDPQTYCVKKR
jgi:hypothetical protein